MVGRWLAVVVVVAVGCSGKSEKHEGSSDNGGTPNGTGGTNATSGMSGMSGTSGAAGAAGSGGASGSGGKGGNYVPDDPNVPPEGDGRVTGSFETELGFGWDYCFTSHPGARVVREASGPSASEGSSYMSFDSTLECTNPCSSDGENAQFGFWLDAPVPQDEGVHLYFDAINLADDVPSGTLQVDAIGPLCATTAPLATIALEDLALTSSWQTRCVTFLPTMPFEVFGLYVSGETFHVGLDAVRFGPPCHGL